MKMQNRLSAIIFLSDICFHLYDYAISSLNIQINIIKYKRKITLISKKKRFIKLEVLYRNNLLDPSYV